MIPLFHDGFESSGADAWDSVQGTPSFIAGAANSGNYGMECDTTGGATTAYVSRSAITYYGFSFYLTVKTAPSSDVPILGGSGDVRLVLTTDRKLEVWSPATLRITGTAQLTLDETYRVSYQSYTGGDSKLYVNGIQDGSSYSSVLAFGALNLGILESVTAHLYFDDFIATNQDGDSDDPGDIHILAARPTANGSDQDFGNDQWQNRTGGTDTVMSQPNPANLAEDPPDTDQGGWEEANNTADYWSVALDDCGSGNLADIGGSDTIMAVNFMFYYATAGGGSAGEYNMYGRDTSGRSSMVALDDPKDPTWIAQYRTTSWDDDASAWSQSEFNDQQMGMMCQDANKDMWWYEAFAMVAYEPAAAGALSVNVADSNPAVTDAATMRLLQLKPSASDPVGVTDAATVERRDMILSVNVGESNPDVADSASVSVTPLKVNISDSVGLSDSAAQSVTPLKVSAADTLGLTDNTIARLMQLKVSAAETVGLQDALTLRLTILRISTADTLTTIDGQVLRLNLLKLSPADVPALSDLATVRLLQLKTNPADSLGLAETATVRLTRLKINVADTVGLTDAATMDIPVAGELEINVADTVGLSESRALKATVFITDIYGLQAMEDDLAGLYKLANDIDASPANPNSGNWDSDEWPGTTGFRPIGEYSAEFTGGFSGGGYKIIGLYIDRPTRDECGLFGNVTCDIKDVSLESVDITGDWYTGSLIGFSIGNIINCHSSGVVHGQHLVGGLCGDFGFGYTSEKMQNCSSSANVVCNDQNAGGLVGYSELNIEDCFASGNVTANGYAGGLCGVDTGSIKRCFATGDVTGSGSDPPNIGGLIGARNSSHSLEDCYATGDASAYESVGGLIGRDSSTTPDVKRCYSVGGVDDTGGGSAGGLVGSVDNSPSGILDCFWDTQTSGQASSAAGTGKTTAQMNDVATFTDTDTEGLDSPWDFVGNPYDDTGNQDYWDIKPIVNDGYPVLTAFGLTQGLSDALGLTDAVTVRVVQQKVGAADSLGLSDDVTVRLKLRNINAADTLAVAEAQTVRLLQLKLSTGDSLTLTESQIVRLLQLKCLAADTLGLADQTTIRISPLKINVADSLMLTDDAAASVSAEAVLDVNVSDTVTTTDARTVRCRVRFITQTENLSVTDAATMQLDLLKATAADSTELSDAAAARLTLLKLNPSDPVGLTDSTIQNLTPLKISVADTLTLTDDRTARLAQLKISNGDAIALTDAVVTQLNLLNITSADSLGLGESLTVRLPTLKADVSDSVGLADAATSRLTILNVNIPDSLTVGDSASLVIPALGLLELNVADSLTVEEGQAARLLQLKISSAEAVGVADAVTVRLLQVKIDVSDTLGLTDAQTVHWLIFSISAADTAGLTEAATVRLLQLRISAAESIGLTDALSLLVHPLILAVADALGLSDSSTLRLAILKVISGDAVGLTDAILATLIQLKIDAADALAIAESVSLSRTTEGIWEINIADPIQLAESVNLTKEAFAIAVADILGFGDALSCVRVPNWQQPTDESSASWSRPADASSCTWSRPSEASSVVWTKV